MLRELGLMDHATKNNNAGVIKPSILPYTKQNLHGGFCTQTSTEDIIDNQGSTVPFYDIKVLSIFVFIFYLFIFFWGGYGVQYTQINKHTVKKTTTNQPTTKQLQKKKHFNGFYLPAK